MEVSIKVVVGVLLIVIFFVVVVLLMTQMGDSSKSMIDGIAEFFKQLISGGGQFEQPTDTGGTPNDDSWDPDWMGPPPN